MKKSFFLILILGFFILSKTFAQNNEGVQGTWNGTVTMVEKYAGALGTSERYIEVTIKDNAVTGTHKFTADAIIEGKHLGHDECFGSGPGEISSLYIKTWDSTYSIGITSPECKLVAGGGNSGTGGTGIGISNQRLQIKNNQLNTTELSGTFVNEKDLGGDLGKYTETVTWHLVRSLDVELIVTPIGYDRKGVQKAYDDWLPEPGRDELAKGSVLKIRLKLQSKSGKPLQYKASSFKLSLANTSREKGITINYPVNPGSKQLPDLRFIPAAIAESNKEDQEITVTTKDGISGETFIASYDGGGWTTLTAIAILKEETQVTGQLLASGGVTDIQVPERKPGTKIATSWLTANKNPGEMDDIDSSANNSNKGDGLTAYEEYRGVIAEGEFKRLDPSKKDLGVVMKKTEFPLFIEGIKWLERAGFINVVKFFDTEIPTDRRLNNNDMPANGYKQYVERLVCGAIDGDAVGENQPIRILAKLPEQSQRVIIDTAKLKLKYRRQVAALATSGIRLPYTEAEQMANTVAHELAHGVNLDHHGPSSDEPNKTIPKQSADIYHVYDDRHHEILKREFPIDGLIGTKGCDESGDTSCIMAYTSLYQWALRVHADGSFNYYSVPLMSMGRTFCTSKDGKGINANDGYFSDAKYGNCADQIKLRN